MVYLVCVLCFHVITVINVVTLLVPCYFDPTTMLQSLSAVEKCIIFEIADLKTKIKCIPTLWATAEL